MNYYVKEKLRKNYDTILFIVKTCKELNDGNFTEGTKSLIKSLKTEIRQVYHNEDKAIEENNGKIVHASEDGENIIYKYVFDCDSRKEFEETKEDITENAWMHIYSPYDCTGKRFTSGMSFFYIPSENKMIWYHFTELDV